MTDKNDNPTPPSDAVDHEAYQKTQAQLEAIEQEIKATQPLTSELLEISTLREHYPAEESTSKYFLLGVNELEHRYGKLRKTRGDGNCYYRSFLYRLCETLLHNATERTRVLQYGGYNTVVTEGRRTRRLIVYLNPLFFFLIISCNSQGIEYICIIRWWIRRNGL